MPTAISALHAHLRTILIVNMDGPTRNEFALDLQGVIKKQLGDVPAAFPDLVIHLLNYECGTLTVVLEAQPPLRELQWVLWS